MSEKLLNNSWRNRERNLLFKGINTVGLLVCLLSFGAGRAQSETVEVQPFEKVVISPYIEVVFKQAEKESVVINALRVDREQLNIEVKRHKLHIYLEGAPVVTKEEKVVVNGHKRRREIYQGTEARLTVYYKRLEDAEIRGEERIDFENVIRTENFDLDSYGSPKIYFKSITAKEFKVALYGDSYVEIQNGAVGFQRYRVYGGSQVNALDLTSARTKIAAYGSNHLKVHVTDKLKVSAFGDAEIQYKGNPKINNGLKIGDTTIQKID